MKLSQIASETNSTIEQGDPESEITGVAGLDDARPGEISFLANPRYSPKVKSTKASAVILDEKEVNEREDLAVLRAADPTLAYARATSLFAPEESQPRDFRHPSAVVDDSAVIGTNVEINANVVVGKNCRIEDRVRLHPNSTIYEGVSIGAGSVIHSGVALRENTSIGQNCIIHNNCVIGSDGFGYAKTEERRWFKIPQTGKVVIEDDVEIGAGTCVDRPVFGETRLERGAKVDNLVQIGHSCVIGEDSLICAQCGLAGSSHVGKRVILAGQVGIAGHLTIGDDAVLTAKSAVSSDVESGKVISGIPGFENREWLRASAAYRRLGDLARTVRKLEREIREKHDR